MVALGHVSICLGTWGWNGTKLPVWAFYPFFAGVAFSGLAAVWAFWPGRSHKPKADKVATE